jgi:hypothetical protein
MNGVVFGLAVSPVIEALITHPGEQQEPAGIIVLADPDLWSADILAPPSVQHYDLCHARLRFQEFETDEDGPISPCPP